MDKLTSNNDKQTIAVSVVSAVTRFGSHKAAFVSCRAVVYSCRADNRIDEDLCILARFANPTDAMLAIIAFWPRDSAGLAPCLNEVSTILEALNHV